MVNDDVSVDIVMPLWRTHAKSRFDASMKFGRVKNIDDSMENHALAQMLRLLVLAVHIVELLRIGWVGGLLRIGGKCGQER